MRIRITTIVAGAAVLAAVTAGCGHAAAIVHKAEAKSGCVISAHSWYKGSGSRPGGKALWLDVGHALEAAGKADTAAARARFDKPSVAVVRDRTAGLSAAVGKASADLPPACVTGVRPKIADTLASFRKVAADQNRAIAAAEAGKSDAATAAIKQANADAVAGGKSFKAAGRALRAYLAK